jgi:glycosyltransferase involved in cell wall biosynthesis
MWMAKLKDVTMLNKSECECRDVTAIITAMVNSEQPFLRRTVEAVLADSCINQVVLCIERSNTWVDATLGDLIQDPRLEIVRSPMGSVSTIRNQALDYVKTPWVAFCDGDDVWCKDKIRIQRAWADSTKSDFVGADHYLMSEDGWVCAFALARNIPMPSSWLVRTEVMRQYPFQESLRLGEDGEWWIRTEGLVHKARCPQMLLKYRVRAGSLSSTTPSKQRKAKIVAFASFPVLSLIILLLTGCVWLCTRRKNYVWLREWGSEFFESTDLISNCDGKLYHVGF